jgi:hypothetical protein
LVKEIYLHPLLKKLEAKKGKSSYISGETFARAFVDVLDPKAKDMVDATKAVQNLKKSIKKANLPHGVQTPVLSTTPIRSI